MWVFAYLQAATFSRSGFLPHIVPAPACLRHLPFHCWSTCQLPVRPLFITVGSHPTMPSTWCVIDLVSLPCLIVGHPVACAVTLWQAPSIPHPFPGLCTHHNYTQPARALEQGEERNGCGVFVNVQHTMILTVCRSTTFLLVLLTFACLYSSLLLFIPFAPATAEPFACLPPGCRRLYTHLVDSRLIYRIIGFVEHRLPTLPSWFLNEHHGLVRIRSQDWFCLRLCCQRALPVTHARAFAWFGGLLLRGFTQDCLPLPRLTCHAIRILLRVLTYLFVNLHLCQCSAATLLLY